MGRASEEEWEWLAAPDVEPDPMRLALVLQGPRGKPRSRSLLSWIDRLCQRVQRSSAQVARHSPSNRLNNSPQRQRCEETDSACPHGQDQLRSWIIRTMSWLTITIHSTFHTLCLGTSALVLVPSCRIIYVLCQAQPGKPLL